MPWARFLAAFNYRVKHNVTIAYKAGDQYLVKADCAEQAIRAGKAVATERPDKPKVDEHGDASR